MSEYIGNGENAAFRRDHELVGGLNDLSELRVAQALEEGAGGPGTTELEYLLMALFRRDWGREIVRKRGRGKRNIQLEVVAPDDAWFEHGLPEETRRELVAGLRSGTLQIRKAIRPKTGRPRADFSAKLLLGFDLLKEMKRLAVLELQLTGFQANFFGLDSEMPKGVQTAAIKQLHRQRQKYAAPPDYQDWERYCLAALAEAKAVLRA